MPNGDVFLYTLYNLYVFNKYIIPNYVISLIVLATQIVFASLGLYYLGDLIWWIGVVIPWALGAMYGGWLQWVGDKHHDADGYIITAGMGLQIPFAAFLTIYFTYRFETKGDKNGLQ